MEAMISVAIVDEPLRDFAGGATSDCGAIVTFDGVVRANENGTTIAGLNYEAYAAMAESEIRRIAGELLAQYPCREVQIAHRIGFVPVGEAAIKVRILSGHRGEAFSFLEHFMNRLKQDVPIWKQTSQSSAPKS